MLVRRFIAVLTGDQTMICSSDGDMATAPLNSPPLTERNQNFAGLSKRLQALLRPLRHHPHAHEDSAYSLECGANSQVKWRAGEDKRRRSEELVE